MQRHCLTLDLRDDQALVAEYIALHRAVWPEVQASIRAAGVVRMEIFRLGTRLCMVLDCDESFSFARKAAMDAANPKVLEWEQLMARFQSVDQDSNPVARWQPMERIFALTSPEL